MTEQSIRFEDGASYERFMGVWSRLAGDVFLDWLNPDRGLRWIDVGCGNGAFTGRLLERCAPAAVEGVDPSESQLAFARSRSAAGLAKFTQGDAQALPFTDNAFDAATMALVIFFVPDPAKGVAEMTRVVRSGGTVAAYAWDMLGGGFPLALLHEEMRALGSPPMFPPHPEAATIDGLRRLWQGAGLKAVETREITVRRTFASFDESWTISMMSGGTGPIIAKMTPDQAALLKQRVGARFPADAAGRITYSARASAVKGRKP